MNVAIIGGTGNISTPVVAALLEAGHEVTCVNRGLSGPVPEGAHLLVGDRDDVDWFVPAMQSGRFDAAIDFISFTPEHAKADVEAFRDTGHLIHVSTVAVFGNEFDWLPVSEDHPTRPNTPYATGKLAGEQALLEAHSQAGFPVTIFRPSTTYGPVRLLSQAGIGSGWISRIRQGRPIIKVGDGRALHQFLHVGDTAPAFLGALGRQHCMGETYLMVHPQLVTWQDWHQAAMAVLGRDVEQVGVPIDTLTGIDADRFRMASNIFSHNLYFDGAKLERDVPEFSPRLGIEEGLRQSIAALEGADLVEAASEDDWEDRVIAAQRAVASAARLSN